jgi:hypothetical protein
MAAICARHRNMETGDPSMNIDKRWFVLLAVAVSAAAGAAVASKSRRRHLRTAHDHDHKAAVRSWENEGGNLAPIPMGATLP